MKKTLTLPKNIFLEEFHKNFAKNKVLLIYSETSKTNGVLERVQSKLGHCNIEKFNTSILKIKSDLFDFSSKLFDNKYDFIIGIGGGTQIDLTKILYSRILEYHKKDRSLNTDFTISNPKLVFVNTLPGSGAEASKTAVVNSKNEKLFISSNDFLPEAIFYDIPSIKTVKKGRIVLGLIDAILHAVESRNSILYNAFSEVFSYFVIKNGIEILNMYIQKGNSIFDDCFIEKVCTLSLYGGLSQSESGSGLCHALAHTLESIFRLSHVESIFLSSFIFMQYKRENDRFKEKELLRNKLNLLYDKVFDEKQKSVHTAILNNLEVDNFVLKCKKDPCWRLERNKIKTDAILKSLHEAKDRKKWNI